MIKLIGFRGSRRGVYSDCGVIEVDEKSPAKLIGEKVAWVTPTGRRITGKIICLHGRSGFLVRFKKGLPGNALGSELIIPRLVKVEKAVKKAEKKAPEKKKSAKPKKVEAKKAPEEKEAPAKLVEAAVEKAEKKAPEKKKKAPAKKVSKKPAEKPEKEAKKIPKAAKKKPAKPKAE